MLRNRFLSAILLIPLIICLILYLPIKIISSVILFIIFISHYELNNLIKKRIIANILYCICIITIIFTSNIFINYFTIDKYIMQFIVCFWIINVILLINYKQIYQYIYKHEFLFQLFFVFISFGFYISLINLLNHVNGKKYILYALFVIWSNDIGAYFVGKFFGNYKLAKEISPNKTIEGLLGGLICGLVIAAIGSNLLFTYFSWYWLLLNFIAIVFSVFGDLLESLFKRLANIKDSGNIIPGHGGLLDRLDSLWVGIPILSLGINLMI